MKKSFPYKVLYNTTTIGCYIKCRNDHLTIIFNSIFYNVKFYEVSSFFVIVLLYYY